MVREKGQHSNDCAWRPTCGMQPRLLPHPAPALPLPKAKQNPSSVPSGVGSKGEGAQHCHGGPAVVVVGRTKRLQR